MIAVAALVILGTAAIVGWLIGWLIGRTVPDGPTSAAVPSVELPRVDTATGEHDRYPQLSDEVRQTCIGYLETLYALPSTTEAP